MTVLPEPPDGTRIEFEAMTDLEAAWRDDASSVAAGYPKGCGWLVYGRTVPMTWADMIDEFGYHALKYAVRLVPVAEDVPNRDRWPTVVYAATGAMGVEDRDPRCICVPDDSGDYNVVDCDVHDDERATNRLVVRAGRRPSDPIAVRHTRHYQSCGCLGRSAVCCDATCPCRAEP